MYLEMHFEPDQSGEDEHRWKGEATRRFKTAQIARILRESLIGPNDQPLY